MFFMMSDHVVLGVTSLDSYHEGLVQHEHEAKHILSVNAKKKNRYSSRWNLYDYLCPIVNTKCTFIMRLIGTYKAPTERIRRKRDIEMNKINFHQRIKHEK